MRFSCEIDNQPAVFIVTTTITTTIWIDHSHEALSLVVNMKQELTRSSDSFLIHYSKWPWFANTMFLPDSILDCSLQWSHVTCCRLFSFVCFILILIFFYKATDLHDFLFGIEFNLLSATQIEHLDVCLHEMICIVCECSKRLTYDLIVESNWQILGYWKQSHSNNKCPFYFMMARHKQAEQISNFSKSP